MIVLFIGIRLASVAMFSSKGFPGLSRTLAFFKNAYGYRKGKFDRKLAAVLVVFDHCDMFDEAKGCCRLLCEIGVCG